MNGLMRFFFVAVLCSVAASLRPAAAAEPLQTLRKDHPAAAPVDAAKLAAIPRGGVPRNIILIIGDGMGQGAINFASLHAHGAPGRLSFEQFRCVDWRVPRRQTAGSPIPLPPVPHSPAAGRPATAWSA